MHDERRQVRYRAGVDHRLRQLRGVLADVAHGRGGDALEGYLGLLDAENQQRDRPRVQNVLRQV